MAVLMFLVLFLGLAARSSATYCLCKDGVGDSQLQKALDYACGAGADCTPILQNGPCFQPNTVKDHCNYAVNSYFQRKGQATGTCDFSGTATPSANPPQTVPSGCSFPSSATPSTGTGTPGTGTPTITPPAGTGTPTGTNTGTPTGTNTGTNTGGTGGIMPSPPTVFNSGLGPAGTINDNAGVAMAPSTNFFFFFISSLTLLFSTPLLWG